VGDEKSSNNPNRWPTEEEPESGVKNQSNPERSIQGADQRTDVSNFRMLQHLSD